MPPEETLYPEKTLKYRICDFFLKKRRKEPGLGTPLSVKLQEMKSLLEYAIGDSEDKRIKALEHELSLLDKERLDGPEEKTVIDILQPPQSKDFITAFKNNETIQVRCFSKNIEEYVLELKTRTRVAIRNYGLAELIHLPSGGVKIILGDKEMKVGKSRNNNFNISVNIIKLMFNGSVTILGDVFSLEDNYKRKDFILFVDLLYVISEIEDDVDRDNQDKIFKSITDAVSNLNEKSMEELGHPLFEIQNEGLNWNL